jgi:hypothetical protein
MPGKRSEGGKNLPARVEAERLPWERQPKEPVRAFHSFAMYRDLGPHRSLSKAAQATGKSLDGLKQLSTKYGWVERAEAYDDDYDRRRREELETERMRLDRTHMGLGAQFIGLALTRLAGRPASVGPNGPVEPVAALNPNDMDAGDVIRAGVEGMRMQRVAAGMPTDLVRGVTQVAASDVVRMASDLVTMAAKFVPEERQARFYAELEAYLESGRML